MKKLLNNSAKTMIFDEEAKDLDFLYYKYNDKTSGFVLYCSLALDCFTERRSKDDPAVIQYAYI